MQGIAFVWTRERDLNSQTVGCNHCVRLASRVEGRSGFEPDSSRITTAGFADKASAPCLVPHTGIEPALLSEPESKPGASAIFRQWGIEFGTGDGTQTR